MRRVSKRVLAPSEAPDRNADALERFGQLEERLQRQLSAELRLAAVRAPRARIERHCTVEKTLSGDAKRPQFVQGCIDVATVMIDEPMHGVDRADRVAEQFQDSGQMRLQRIAIAQTQGAVVITLLLLHTLNVALSFGQGGKHSIASGGRQF